MARPSQQQQQQQQQQEQDPNAGQPQDAGDGAQQPSHADLIAAAAAAAVAAIQQAQQSRPAPGYEGRLRLPNVPMLGTAGVHFVEWKRRIQDRLEYHKLGAMLTDPDQLKEHWPVAKELLLSSVPAADSNLIRTAGNWLEAMRNLEQLYAPNREIQGYTMKAELFKLQFEANETVPTLINRARTMASNLEHMGNPVPEGDVITAVISAIKGHPVYGQQLANFLAGVPGHLTLPKLQESFAALGMRHDVPGAFTATARTQPPPLLHPQLQLLLSPPWSLRTWCRLCSVSLTRCPRRAQPLP